MSIIRILRKARALLARGKNKLERRECLPVSRLFDEKWYLNAYTELQSVSDPWAHYLLIGGFEGRRPNPIFDSEWYLRKHPELLKEKRNPLVHYIEQGVAEGADPSPLFSTAWYLNAYTDVVTAGLNPLAHYLEYGGKEGRNPSPYFYASWYLKEYPEIVSVGSNPLAHYLSNGGTGDYDPNPFFYSAWYMREYSNIYPVGTNLLIHFIEHGEELGNSPNPFFNYEWYRAQNPDLSDSRRGLFKHFLDSIHRERRYPEPKPNHFTNVDLINGRLASLAPSIRPVSCSAYLRLSSVAQWLTESFDPDAGEIVFTLKERSCEGVAESTFPKLPYVAKLNKVNVLAGTRYMFAKGNAVLHDEEHHFYDIEGSALKYINAQRIGNGWINIRFHLRQGAWIENGINMMHEYSSNYFHFIAETIPRMILAEEAGLPHDIPYLFEDNLHSNIRGLLDLVNGTRRDILWLEPGTLFSARTIYAPSDLTSVVDAYHGGEIARQSTLDVARIRQGVLRCKKAFSGNYLTTKRKIFASRGGGIRQLLNQQELEKHFSSLGFDIVRADTLDLEAQIRTFQNAEVIVGPTGAQMSNIVWCDPGTKVVILASDHPSHQLYFWELLGRVSDVSVEIIQGPRAYTKNDKYSVHDDYTVAIDEIMAFIGK